MSRVALVVLLAVCVWSPGTATEAVASKKPTVVSSRSSVTSRSTEAGGKKRRLWQRAGRKSDGTEAARKQKKDNGRKTGKNNLKRQSATPGTESDAPGSSQAGLGRRGSGETSAGKAKKQRGKRARAWAIDKRRRYIKPTSKRLRYASTKVTQVVDQVQARLPEPLQPVMENARDLNPANIVRFFAGDIMRGDVIIYKVASSFGMNALNAYQLAQGTPLWQVLLFKYGVGTLGDAVVVTASRHLRRGERSQSIVETVKNLGRDYRQFARDGREMNRRRGEHYDAIRSRQQAEQANASSQPIVTPL